MRTSSDAEQFALNTQETARLGWMALMLTPEMGPTRIARAMERLGAAERVFEASLTELEGAGLPARAAQFVLKAAHSRPPRMRRSVLPKRAEAF